MPDVIYSQQPNPRNRCTRYGGHQSTSVQLRPFSVSFNGGILLVILFPRDTATVTALDCRDFWAFNDINARHYFRHLEDDQQYPEVCFTAPMRPLTTWTGNI